MQIRASWQVLATRTGGKSAPRRRVVLNAGSWSSRSADAYVGTPSLACGRRSGDTGSSCGVRVRAGAFVAEDTPQSIPQGAKGSDRKAVQYARLRSFAGTPRWPPRLQQWVRSLDWLTCLGPVAGICGCSPRAGCALSRGGALPFAPFRRRVPIGRLSGSVAAPEPLLVRPAQLDLHAGGSTDSDLAGRGPVGGPALTSLLSCVGRRSDHAWKRLMWVRLLMVHRHRRDNARIAACTSPPRGGARLGGRPRRKPRLVDGGGQQLKCVSGPAGTAPPCH
mmetsp:Transcript_107168/g.302985  ORF Transcript_107168/g.302985 Transcript_107168/m.302985 type:complete len:278 (-) Transcript_107168:2-835(-)